MKIEHIGIAVCNLESAIRIYSVITESSPHRETIDQEKVKIATYNLDNVKIELLEGIDENSPVSKFLKNKNKDTVHHIAFEVKNLKESLKKLERSGYSLIKGYPKDGAEGTKVAFLHPANTGGVLIELVEKK